MYINRKIEKLKYLSSTLNNQHYISRSYAPIYLVFSVFASLSCDLQGCYCKDRKTDNTAEPRHSAMSSRRAEPRHSAMSSRRDDHVATGRYMRMKLLQGHHLNWLAMLNGELVRFTTRRDALQALDQAAMTRQTGRHHNVRVASRYIEKGRATGLNQTEWPALNSRRNSARAPAHASVPAPAPAPAHACVPAPAPAPAHASVPAPAHACVPAPASTNDAEDGDDDSGEEDDPNNRGDSDDDDCVRDGFYLHYPGIPCNFRYKGARFIYEHEMSDAGDQEASDEEEESDDDSDICDDAPQFLVITQITHTGNHCGWCSDPGPTQRTRTRTHFRIPLENLTRSFRDEFFNQTDFEASHRFWYALHNIVTNDTDGQFCSDLVTALSSSVTREGDLVPNYDQDSCECYREWKCDYGVYNSTNSENYVMLDPNPRIEYAPCNNCDDSTESCDEWQ